MIKLKSYVYAVDCVTEVLIRGGERWFLISGANAYEQVERIFRYFNGQFTREQIKLALPEPLRDWFDNLVDELVANDFLVSGGAASQAQAPSMLDDFGLFHFLQDWHSDPAAALSAWQAASVAVNGDGGFAARVRDAVSAIKAGTGSRSAGASSAPSLLISCVEGPAENLDLAAVGTGRILPVHVGESSILIGPVIDAEGYRRGGRLLRAASLTVESAQPSELSIGIAASLVALGAFRTVVDSVASKPVRPLEGRILRVDELGLISEHLISEAIIGPSRNGHPSYYQDTWQVSETALPATFDPVTGIFEIDRSRSDDQSALHLSCFRLQSRLGLSSHSALGWGRSAEEAAYRAHLGVATDLAMQETGTENGLAMICCRDPARIVDAKEALTTDVSIALAPLAECIPPKGEAAAIARLIAFWPDEDISMGAADTANGWWQARMAYRGAIHWSVGETQDMVLSELLGAVLAELQSGGNGGEQLRPNRLAAKLAAPDQNLIGFVDQDAPLSSRLGWSSAVVPMPLTS